MCLGRVGFQIQFRIWRNPLPSEYKYKHAFIICSLFQFVDVQVEKLHSAYFICDCDNYKLCIFYLFVVNTSLTFSFLLYLCSGENADLTFPNQFSPVAKQIKLSKFTFFYFVKAPRSRKLKLLPYQCNACSWLCGDQSFQSALSINFLTVDSYHSVNNHCDHFFQLWLILMLAHTPICGTFRLALFAERKNAILSNFDKGDNNKYVFDANSQFHNFKIKPNCIMCFSRQ